MAQEAVSLEGQKGAIGAIEAVKQTADLSTPEVQLALGLVLTGDVDRRLDEAPGVESGGIVWGGEYWEPLTDPYLKRNPRRRGGKIGKDTGEMAQSLSVGNPGNIAEAQGQTVFVFGSSLIKAAAFHKRRPLLFVHPALVDQVLGVVIDDLGRRMDKAIQEGQ